MVPSFKLLTEIQGLPPGGRSWHGTSGVGKSVTESPCVQGPCLGQAGSESAGGLDQLSELNLGLHLSPRILNGPLAFSK
jgi:hypothetical protein